MPRRRGGAFLEGVPDNLPISGQLLPDWSGLMIVVALSVPDSSAAADPAVPPAYPAGADLDDAPAAPAAGVYEPSDDADSAPDPYDDAACEDGDDPLADDPADGALDDWP